MRYDLVIVGGGLVGAGLAAALKHTTMRIALVDARMPSNNDPRLFALNHYSCEFIKNLGIWPALDSYAAPIHQVHVSSRGHFGAVKLKREDVQLDALGYVVPARYIEAALDSSLRAPTDCDISSLRAPEGRVAIQLFRPANLKSISQEADHAVLELEVDGIVSAIEASIVIAADGADSTIRKQLQIPTETIDYQQSAIVTRTTLKRSHHHIAYERFNSLGAIAMLPLPGNECATIWTTADTRANELMALDNHAFLNELQQSFGYRLGRFEQISQRHVFPLRLVRAKKMVEQSVFLLGNSAHAMHPIAAQGFNLALFEVAMLLDVIMKKQISGEQLAAHDLHAVSQQAAGHQKYSVDMSHRLAGLFAGDSLLKNHALSLGMTALNMVQPARAKFINMMMGRSGAMPRLLMSTEDEKHFTAAN